jgi:hypothetical protein
MNWLCTINTWLSQNSTTVTAIATLVTGFATVVIAWASVVSSRIVRLEEKRECANRMPMLTFVKEQTGDHRSMYVKNAGYGPALNIVRKVINPGSLLRTEAGESLSLGSLGPAERCTHISQRFHQTLALRFSTIRNSTPSLECDDVLDGHYEFTYKDRVQSKPTSQ